MDLYWCLLQFLFLTTRCNNANGKTRGHQIHKYNFVTAKRVVHSQTFFLIKCPLAALCWRCVWQFEFAHVISVNYCCRLMAPDFVIGCNLQHCIWATCMLKQWFVEAKFTVEYIFIISSQGRGLSPIILCGQSQTNYICSQKHHEQKHFPPCVYACSVFTDFGLTIWG